MLTVWSVCVGDKYPDYYVQRLKREVAKNLTIEHEFLCLSDRQIQGITTVTPPNDLPGWWQKVNLFSGEVSRTLNAYFDLDVVITGSLDSLVDLYVKTSFACPLNWAQSGHGGCQSSVMLWKNNYNIRQVYDLFDHKDAHWPPVNKPGVLWGDQEWITHLRDTSRIHVNPINPDWVKSYKYHCRNGLPGDCRVVVFHGEPKPAEVNESWFTW